MYFWDTSKTLYFYIVTLHALCFSKCNVGVIVFTRRQFSQFTRCGLITSRSSSSDFVLLLRSDTEPKHQIRNLPLGENQYNINRLEFPCTSINHCSRFVFKEQHDSTGLGGMVQSHNTLRLKTHSDVSQCNQLLWKPTLMSAENLG